MFLFSCFEIIKKSQNSEELTGFNQNFLQTQKKRISLMSKSSARTCSMSICTHGGEFTEFSSSEFITKLEIRESEFIRVQFIRVHQRISIRFQSFITKSCS
ncbi:hypothetical protein AAHE18_07G067700 [Arachis hypogaea]